MKIGRVYIKNYRNIEEADVNLSKMTTIIGNNNSGKSNFLKALTLPLLSEDLGYINKRLNWNDININAKDKYYQYIKENKNDILTNKVKIDEFQEIVPIVSVQLDFDIEENERYAVKEICTNKEDGDIQYSIKYEYKCKNISALLEHIKSIIQSKGDSFDNIKLIQSLLPLNLFDYKIIVPYKNQSISYDVLKNFKYNSIEAERDEFSSVNSSLGSKSLLKLLNKNLSNDALVKIEEEYITFFEEIKKLSDMDKILNWQDQVDIANAKDFFDKINIVPNMPRMNSLLSSVKLGYDEMELSLQGLGYRNLILQMVLLNSLIEVSETMFSLLTVEEPEAHLCYSNEQLLKSYLQIAKQKDSNLQLVFTTHSSQFINKLNLGEIIFMNDGNAYPLKTYFNQEELNYLAKNPNLDLFKLFYSKNLILVEGITEEILIKSYLNKIGKLNDVEVITFHKGYRKIIKFWKVLNDKGNNRLAVIRDFDDQKKAQEEHEKLADNQKVFVSTTENYTLEDDIVKKEGNFELLKNYFETEHNWNDIDTCDKLSEKWKGSKADIMLQFCLDLSDNRLTNFKLPDHIESVLQIFVENPVSKS